MSRRAVQPKTLCVMRPLPFPAAKPAFHIRPSCIMKESSWPRLAASIIMAWVESLWILKDGRGSAMKAILI